MGPPKQSSSMPVGLDRSGDLQRVQSGRGERPHIPAPACSYLVSLMKRKQRYTDQLGHWPEVKPTTTTTTSPAHTQGPSDSVPLHWRFKRGRAHSDPSLRLTLVWSPYAKTADPCARAHAHQSSGQGLVPQSRLHVPAEQSRTSRNSVSRVATALKQEEPSLPQGPGRKESRDSRDSASKLSRPATLRVTDQLQTTIVTLGVQDRGL